jgi:hypothetical protein
LEIFFLWINSLPRRDIGAWAMYIV